MVEIEKKRSWGDDCAAGIPTDKVGKFSKGKISYVKNSKRSDSMDESWSKTTDPADEGTSRWDREASWTIVSNVAKPPRIYNFKSLKCYLKS